MPFENEHACRVREPGLFQSDSFRRISSGKVDIIIGRLKGQASTTTQAFRYPTSRWTESKAREHCKEQKGRFETATGEIRSQEMQCEDCFDPAIIDILED